MPQPIRDPNEIEQNTSRWVLLGARDPNGEAIYPLNMDETVRGVATLGYVWNSSTMAWEKQQQAVINIGDLTVTMGDVEALLADFYFQRVKIYYDVNDNAEYICKNTDIDAAEADIDWYCWKLVYDGNNNMIDKEGPRQGAVTTAPSGLAWNI